MTEKNNIDQLIQQQVESTNISCKSFIVTVFGDVISQHGGWIWLGSLISSLQPLGFSERLIRTSVFRLVKEDWLQVKKVGRKSFYAFTDPANKHYTKAARRIYAGKIQHSDGRWLILVPAFVDENKLNLLKRQLTWMGFSALTTGVFAHPSIDQTSLEETINELELSDSVIIFSSRTLDDESELTLKKLVHQKWNLQNLQESYQKLIDDYSPLLKILKISNISEQQLYLLRCLLIHAYRRILLKDYELPKSMLPDNWSGFYANQLVKELYSFFSQGSQQYITNQLENAEGSLLKAHANFNKRFAQ